MWFLFGINTYLFYFLGVFIFYVVLGRNVTSFFYKVLIDFSNVIDAIVNLII